MAVSIGSGSGGGAAGMEGEDDGTKDDVGVKEDAGIDDEEDEVVNSRCGGIG